MLDLAGEWWLPERPDRRVPGSLTVDDDGRARLDLHGELRTFLEEGERSLSEDGKTTKIAMTADSLDAAGTYPRIVGQAKSRYVTLEDCLRGKHTRSLDGGTASESIHCGYVFDGLAFEAAELAEFDGIRFQVKWLSHWLQETAIEESRQVEKSDSVERWAEITLSVRQKEARTLPLERGQLVLGHSFGIHGDRTRERTLSQGHYFRVELDELVPAEDLLDVASDLQDLVSMAVVRTAEFEGTVALLHPQAVRTDSDGESHRKRINWYAEWTARDRNPKTSLSDYDMIFTFQEFGGIEGIARWLDVAARHRSALGRVMATRYSEHMYLSDRVLNRAAALEALDREESGFLNSAFATRLTRCVQLAGEPFNDLVGDVEEWVRKFKDDRDDVAHHYGRRLRSQTREQLFLADSAYWLFAFCVLRLAGAPQAVFDHAGRNPAVQWTKRGLVRP